MLNSVLGSFSSGVAASTSSFESIASYTPTSGTSVTFSSIPSTYASLQIRGIMLGASTFNLSVQLNTDTAANYSMHNLLGSGAAVSAGGQANTDGLYGSPNNTAGSATNPTAFIIDLHDYASTSKYKTSRQFIGIDKNGSGEIGLWSGNWRSTTAVNSVTVYLLSGSFASGSSIALYGIKG